MKYLIPTLIHAAVLCSAGVHAAEQPTATGKPVNVDNFKRAETDLYFAKFAKDGAFGKFEHIREPATIDKQDVIRMNRDTLYSTAMADLDAGPVTVVMPETGGRFMAMQVINEDHYTPEVVYQAGRHTFTGEKIGTRYVMFLARTFVDPNSEEDLKKVHALQDSLKLEQDQPGKFEIPDWDLASAKKIRDALNNLATANGGLDSGRMFGPKDKVDPVQHLLGTAAGWGGNPPEDAYYVGVTPENNDGGTAYQITVRDVPVDGFWSISVYNKDGFFEKNPENSYSVNNVTAKPNADGSVTVRFGGAADGSPNRIPITPGWNYLVRLYRPHPEILNGTWKFPKAEPVR